QGCNYIISNTSNSITLSPGFGTVAPLPKFDTGDTFEIHKVLVILDQPGRGKGDLIIGNPAGSTTLSGTGWPAWPHQSIEPCYSWNNALNGSNINFANNSGENVLQENVDFYNDTPMPGYASYTYPHPLVSGMPTAPTNLRTIP